MNLSSLIKKLQYTMPGYTYEIKMYSDDGREIS